MTGGLGRGGRHHGTSPRRWLRVWVSSGERRGGAVAALRSRWMQRDPWLGGAPPPLGDRRCLARQRSWVWMRCRGQRGVQAARSSPGSGCLCGGPGCELPAAGGRGCAGRRAGGHRGSRHGAAAAFRRFAWWTAPSGDSNRRRAAASAPLGSSRWRPSAGRGCLRRALGRGRGEAERGSEIIEGARPLGSLALRSHSVPGCT